MLDSSSGERLTIEALARRDDFVLGGARISPSTRVLHGPGGDASLEPRAMQVLVVLAEAEGAVVTRDTLFQRCWGAAVVGDDSLNRAVADIRRAARAIAADVTIETVPRTGYRLVDGKADTAGRRLADRRARLPRRALLVAGGAAALGGAGYWNWRRRGSEVDDLVLESDQAMRLAMPEGARQAVDLLERAVALEPRAADAWGRLALAQAWLLDATPPGQAPAVASAVQAAARRALALAPRQPDALAAVAILPPYFGDWLAAERRLQSVLAVAPDHLPTLDELAFLRVAVGRARESANARVAFSPREPLHAGHQYRLIYAHWILGRIGDADRTADRALQLWPKHPAVWFARLWVLAFTGRAARARRHLHDAGARPDLPDEMLATLDTALAALGGDRPADRARTVDRLLAEVSETPSAVVNALLLLNGLGEVDPALAVAQAYYLEDGPIMAATRWRAGQMAVNDQRRRKTHMMFVPVTAPMRADPRFEDLVQRIGLDRYWRDVGVQPDFRQGR